MFCLLHSNFFESLPYIKLLKCYNKTFKKYTCVQYTDFIDLVTIQFIHGFISEKENFVFIFGIIYIIFYLTI